MIYFVRLGRFVSPVAKCLGRAQVSYRIIAVTADQHLILSGAELAMEAVVEACAIGREWLAWQRDNPQRLFGAVVIELKSGPIRTT